MNTHIDTSPRKCSCGNTFRITDYPAGYFHFKYQVKKGSLVNTCPACETKILQNIIKENLSSDNQNTDCIISLQEDVFLLLTGHPASERHRKSARKIYG